MTHSPATDDPGQHFTRRMWRRAQEHLAHGGIAAARGLLEALLGRQPDHFQARMLLASIHLNERRVRAASTQALLAARSVPAADAEAVAAAAQCLLRCGEMVAARDLLARCDFASRPLDAAHLRLLARTHQKLGDNPGALAVMERSFALGHDNPDLRYFHGLQLQFHGRFDAAREEMRQCLRQLPTYGRAALALARLGKRQPDAGRLAFLREHIGAASQGTEEHAAFEFAQFEELEALHEYDLAFGALERGNAIMQPRLAGEVRLDDATVEGMRRVATRAFARGPGFSVADGPVPIFIVGLPRSGTTVLDRMLDNHPDVVSTGERTDFPLQLRWCADLHGDHVLDDGLLERMPDLDYAELGRRYLEQTQWRADGRAFYVDKLPPNYLLVGLIRRALPFAPILHMVRDPTDVCFSNYKTLFGSSYAHSYDLREMAQHHALYCRLMAHWREVISEGFLDIEYAQLVADPEVMLARIFDFCGLRAVAGCSELARNRSTVATMSCIQAREPLDARGIDEWQRYRVQLEPLRRCLRCSGETTN